jgi:hypothetical protein
MKLRLLLALPLLALAACEPEAEEPAPVSEGADMAAEAPAVDVAGTITALGGGVTALPLAAAQDNVNGWIAELDGADFEGADGIADNLRLLRAELSRDDLDGPEIGQILSRLGEQTASAAALDASGDLARLAALLNDAGRALGGQATAGFGQDEEL